MDDHVPAEGLRLLNGFRGYQLAVAACRLNLPEHIDSMDEAFGSVMSDLHMMVVLGGRERTTAEYASLLGAAGLRITHPIRMASDFNAIEAVPD